MSKHVLDERVGQERRAGWPGVELLLVAEVHVEAPRGPGDVEVLALQRLDDEVEQVPRQLAVRRRRVPPAHGQHLDTLGGLGLPLGQCRQRRTARSRSTPAMGGTLTASRN